MNEVTKQDQDGQAPADAAADDRSVLDVIGEIKSGKIDARALSPVDRQACVAHLMGEGLSMAEVAKILKRNDRTITRDRKAIQERNALAHDPALPGQIAGRLLTEADLCVSHLRRIARDRETPAGARVEAQRACFQILSDMVQRLQGLGYLPSAAQRIEAELTHHDGDLPSIEALISEMERVQDAVQTVPPETSGLLEQVEATLDCARRARQLTGEPALLTKEVEHDPS